jgi:hypothetical protein
MPIRWIKEICGRKLNNGLELNCVALLYFVQEREIEQA